MRHASLFGLFIFGILTTVGCTDAAVTRAPAESDGEQLAAGSVGAICYPNGTCNSGLNCIGGYCTAPAVGAEGGPCYANSTCNAGLVCEAARCATGITDTGSSDTGAEDTEIADTGAEETGIEDTGAEDTGSSDTGNQDADSDSSVTCTPAPFAAEGTYLLGINIFPLDRADRYPLLLSTEVVADGAGSYTFTFQPLATDDIIADDGSRTPRTSGARAPVGTPIVVTGVTIGDDRSFNLTVAGLRIIGEANSLTGRDILADINFVDASFRDSNFACGNVTGQATEPINLSLAPSTFAFQRTASFLSATFLADNCNDAAEIPAPAEDCR